MSTASTTEITTTKPQQLSTKPLSECKQAIVLTALYAGTDVRKTLGFLFVCREWQEILSIKSAPLLWKIHAVETEDKDHKLLLRAAQKNLPHLVNILLTKFAVVDSDDLAFETSSLPAVSAAGLDAQSIALEPSVSEDFRRNDTLAKLQPLKTVADVDKRTPLMHIARDNHLDIAKKLIALGSDVNAKDTVPSVGASALHRAAEAGNLEMCQLLIDAGADVFAVDESNWNALIGAVHKGHLNCVELLMERTYPTSSSSFAPAAIDDKKDNNNVEEGNEPVFTPATTTRPTLLEFVDENGCGIFHHAAMSGNLKVFEFICTYALNKLNNDHKELGKSVSRPSKTNQSTALHSAAQSGSKEMVEQTLKRAGIYSQEMLNQADSDGDTALMIAAKFGHQHAVKALLKHGADDLLRNKQGETALSLANSDSRMNPVTARLLRNHQATCCC